MINHKMNPDEQRCRQCKHTKLMEHFSQNKKGDYFKACDPCREYARVYRDNHKEKKKVYNKVYHDANKDEIQEYRKKYYDSNKDMILCKMNAYYSINKKKRKAYREVNKEKINAASKAYKKANPEKLKAYYEANKDRHKCEECGYATGKPSDLRKHACGRSGMSAGEREVFRVLNDLGIDFDFGGNKIYLPIKEATGIGLKFDFIVRFEDRLLFIEYDGRQHFKAVAHWGGEDALKKTQEYDAIKTKFCEDRGYPLLRIPYTKYGIVPSLVVEFLVEYTNWGYE